VGNILRTVYFRTYKLEGGQTGQTVIRNHFIALVGAEMCETVNISKQNTYRTGIKNEEGREAGGEED
jgi:hypothetical protein